VDVGEGRPGAPRGRPRDPERERRVLVAAIEEYSERGWAGLTMDGVAKRAGVGKSTIYLRWTNKEDLLAAAIHAMSDGMRPLDTGSLRGDLTKLAEALVERYWSRLGWGMHRIMIDVAGSGEGVDQFTHLVNSVHRRAALEILERGVSRGELRPDVPAQLVINALYGTLVIYRMMAPWDEIEGVAPEPGELVRRTVDFVMAGLAPYLTGAEDA
jgi:AcrR family transcriptional regulator